MIPPRRLSSPTCKPQSSTRSLHISDEQLHEWKNTPTNLSTPSGSLSHWQSVGPSSRNQNETTLTRWILNGVALKGRLTENDVKVKFHLCQLRLNETVYKNLSEARHNEWQVAAYPTVRSEIRIFSMQGNQARFEANNLFQGRIPDRIIVGLVRNEALNGNMAFDPFCFQKFGLISIKQIVMGEEYPYKTCQLNHDDGQRDLAGYFRFLQASGAWCKKQGNMVRREDWGQGKNCTLFMFDNVANGCADSNALNPRQMGDL